MDTAATWSEKLATITGWEAATKRVIDWPSVEARLGIALPTDYKQLAEWFGSGEFNGFLQLETPDTPGPHHDLIKNAQRLGEQAAADPWIGDLFRPHAVFPAAGGLLRWADSVQADQFFWLTDSADPDRWPILAQAHDDVAAGWERFDGSTSEFIYRVLTDHRQPFSIACYFDTHTFESYEQNREPDPEWDADPHW
ncbi:SMI1/KNR4 family protein [Kitasatospora sp. NPDC094011]|uniref:SMI1/KNR4 family protein n=1 Tax=Kitasatospora sp. NPDC094011 TaxID=3364090 RepID=UPI003815D7E3